MTGKGHKSAKTKATVSSWPELSVGEVAAALEVSTDWIRQLERAGRFKKKSRGVYGSLDVVRGVLAHMRDDERRSSKSAEARALIAARAREITLRTAREEGHLIDIEDAEQTFAQVLATFRAELAGIPAGATRDVALRAKVETEIESAIGRARARFERAGAAMREGRPAEI